MTLTVRALHTHGSVTRHTETAPRYRKPINAAVIIGSRLRAADATVAAIKVDGMPRYMWSGHATAEHCAAISRADINNPNW